MFTVHQCRSQVVNMLSECQTAWIRMTRRYSESHPDQNCLQYDSLVITDALRFCYNVYVNEAFHRQILNVVLDCFHVQYYTSL